MAAVPITLDGMLYDLYQRTSQRIIIFADASLTGLGVGGGPIYPAPGPQPPDGGLHPEHPIIIPPPPIDPPPDLQPPVDITVKPPPPEGGWAYVQPWGWGYYPGPGKPGPKK